MEVTAILVTYNSGFIIEKSLAPLLTSPEIGRIIIVDNFSADDTCDVISRSFPDVEIIRNNVNAGFGRANNAALEKVTTPYALIINPDAFLDDGALAKLVGAAQTYTDAAILAPQQRDVSGEISDTYRPDIFTYNSNRRCYRKFDEAEGNVCSLSFITGAIWLLNMAHLKKTGFYDPAFFLYYEDDDLCIRCRNAGYSAITVSDAWATHMMNSSCGIPATQAEIRMATRRKQTHIQYSRLQLEEKYKGRIAAGWLAARLAPEYAIRLVVCRILGQMIRYNYFIGRLKAISLFSLGYSLHQTQ
jgi:GT2 family glycosyltransferase